VLVVGAHQIVLLTAGAKYLPAVVPLQLFAVAMGLAVATGAWHPLLLAMGHPGRSLLAMCAGVSVQLVILLVGLPAIGTSAAGLAYLGFYLVWIPVVGLSLLSINARARA
jgi:O-antigen/teichoic acid export membrane protein